MDSSEERIDAHKRVVWPVIFFVAPPAAFLFSPLAGAQEASKFAVGLDYNYVRTNAPPGGCGCFSLNGGDAWVSYNFTNSLAAVGQISAQNASDIRGIGGDLTFTSYLFGPRYIHKLSNRIVPFAQVLFGGVHASGSLAPGSHGIAGSSDAFAMTAGGGGDIALTRHLTIRPAQVDYFLTRFSNGTNDHQNNFRFAAGVVLRF